MRPEVATRLLGASKAASLDWRRMSPHGTPSKRRFRQTTAGRFSSSPFPESGAQAERLIPPIALVGFPDKIARARKATVVPATRCPKFVRLAHFVLISDLLCGSHFLCKATRQQSGALQWWDRKSRQARLQFLSGVMQSPQLALCQGVWLHKGVSSLKIEVPAEQGRQTCRVFRIDVAAGATAFLECCTAAAGNGAAAGSEAAASPKPPATATPTRLPRQSPALRNSAYRTRPPFAAITAPILCALPARKCLVLPQSRRRFSCPPYVSSGCSPR